mgnify:CR=1 FL=1
MNKEEEVQGVDFGFIKDLEGYKTTGYVPKKDGEVLGELGGRTHFYRCVGGGVKIEGVERIDGSGSACNLATKRWTPLFQIRLMHRDGCGNQCNHYATFSHAMMPPGHAPTLAWPA